MIVYPFMAARGYRSITNEMLSRAGAVCFAALREAMISRAMAILASPRSSFQAENGQYSVERLIASHLRRVVAWIYRVHTVV